MEDLTKTQIILLTLLVSFVTSIATGIVTVSLLGEAPPEVTQTINRVIEKITPATLVAPEKNKTSVIIKEIIIKEDELIVKGIEKSLKSIVKIKEVVDEEKENFVSLGLVVSDNGTILAENSNLNKNQKLKAVFPDGKIFELKLDRIDEKKNIIILKVILPDSDKDKYNFIPADLADSQTVKLGQMVVGFGGVENKNNVGVGVIASVDNLKDLYSIFDTTLDLKNYADFILLNLGGSIIGFRTGNINPKNSYIPINILKQELASSTISVIKAD